MEPAPASSRWPAAPLGAGRAALSVLGGVSVAGRWPVSNRTYAVTSHRQELWIDRDARLPPAVPVASRAAPGRWRVQPDWSRAMP